MQQASVEHKCRGKGGTDAEGWQASPGVTGVAHHKAGRGIKRFRPRAIAVLLRRVRAIGKRPGALHCAWRAQPAAGRAGQRCKGRPRSDVSEAATQLEHCWQLFRGGQAQNWRYLGTYTCRDGIENNS